MRGRSVRVLFVPVLLLWALTAWAATDLPPVDPSPCEILRYLFHTPQPAMSSPVAPHLTVRQPATLRTMETLIWILSTC